MSPKAQFSTQSTHFVQTGQLIPNPPVENPSAWMRDGQSPAEITLSVAVLTLVPFWGITLVILAIAHLIKALTQNSNNESKDSKNENNESKD